MLLQEILDDAEKAISMGFMLGIGGIVTFKNSGLDKVVKEVGPRTYYSGN